MPVDSSGKLTVRRKSPEPPKPEAKPQRRAPAPASKRAESDPHKSPPHSVDAEQGVLSSALQDARNVVPEISRELSPACFYVPAHNTIFQVLLGMFKDEQPIDLLTVTQTLRDRKLLDAVGGAVFVTELFSFVPTSANVRYYIDIVKEKFLLREMIYTGTEMVRRAYGAEDDAVPGLIERAATSIERIKIFAGGTNGAINFALDDLLSFDISNDPDSLVGRRFLVRGGSWLIAGPTGCGKSSLLVQLSIYWATGTPIFGMKCRRPLKTLIFQAEDDFGDVSEEVQGIFAGIQASEDLDLEKFNTVIRQNLTLKRVRGLSGDKFLSCLEEYVQIHKPDLVGINPLFSYAGCDLCDPAAIGPFLRDQLFVLGEKYHYCTVVMHHTPKPLRDGSDSKDLLYLGFGSSEVQNSFRATSTITQATGSPGIWRFDMGKRLLRSGAKTPAGEMTDVIYLEHSKTGICWLQVAAPETELGSMEDILMQMDFEKPIKTATLQRRMYEEFEMPRRTFFRHWRKLKADGGIKEITGNKGKGWVATGAKGAKTGATNSADF